MKLTEQIILNIYKSNSLLQIINWSNQIQKAKIKRIVWAIIADCKIKFF